MMADMRAGVQEALEAIRQARGVLERMRDVQVTVKGAWQQMDELPVGAAEDLRQRLAEVVLAWTADTNLLMRPAWQVKVDCRCSMDVNDMEMALPALWQESDG